MNKSERTDFITVEEINSIITGYRIGKKPLAKLLGWGETTIIRYVEGDIPTREYSDKLQYIRKNPAYFYQMLENNKDRLTPVAYRKCNQAVRERMLESKIRVVAQYVINQTAGHISLYELQIYLYFIQGFYMVLEKDQMFDDDYIINDSGMPYEVLYEDYSTRSIDVMEMKKKVLSAKEMKYLDQIVEVLSWYGPTMLGKLMDYELLLLKLSRDYDNRKVISKETICEYFTTFMKENNIKTINQIHDYFNHMYITMNRAEWEL